jgi:hypothetical protein
MVSNHFLPFPTETTSDHRPSIINRARFQPHNNLFCSDQWLQLAPPMGSTLTSLCNLTGFASLAFLTRIDSELVTCVVFSHFLCPNGLPKLVILDRGSKFKRMPVTVCKALGIQYHVVAPKDHNVILCKHFH